MSAPSTRLSSTLSDLVEGGGVPYREGSRSWIFDCPRCGKPKLYMYKDTGRFVCWVCREEGFEGRPEYALAELIGVPAKDLKRRLYGEGAEPAVQYLECDLKDFYGDGDEPDEEAVEHQRTAWPLDFYPIDHRYSKRGAEYLQGRGVPLDVAVRYGMRYCPPQRRVAFPISRGGALYGWQARSIVDTSWEDPETGEEVSIPKVLTTKGIKKEHLLMFADNLVGKDWAVLAEGPMDALKADLCGGNVASMGKGVSKAQLQLLRNLGIRRVWAALDPDAAPEIMALARDLSDLEVHDLRAPPPYKDLGEMPFEEVKAAFDAAPRLGPETLVIWLETDWAKLKRKAAKRERERQALQRSRERCR